MGFAAAHKPRFRAFCCLLAAFWAGVTLLGAVRLAAAPALLSSPPASAPHTAYRCPMCEAMHHAGMKCCCHAAVGGSAISCRCGFQPAPSSLAVQVWSPLAVLPAKLLLVPPQPSACRFSAFFPHLPSFCRAPLPRPPRLL